MALEIILNEDAAGVAEAAAKALVVRLGKLLAAKDLVHIVVTGGTVGILTLAKLGELDPSQVDWSRVHVWWGDERFVDSQSPDRNAVQAASAWLSGSNVPKLNIHEFPSSDLGLSLDEAALLFDETLGQFAEAGNRHPEFDIHLLGMGPDGHVASLFPGKPEIHSGVLTVAEHDSPKSPPLRLSMSYELINSSSEVWITVAGADKADAVGVAFSEKKDSLPIGRIAGAAKTVWFIDAAASQKIG